MCLACFPPSKPLRKWLAQYFKDNTEGRNESFSGAWRGWGRRGFALFAEKRALLPAEAGQAKVKQMAQMCLDNLGKVGGRGRCEGTAALTARVRSQIMTLGQRKHVPSRDEINSLKMMKGTHIKVFLIDGSTRTLSVDSYTLVSDVVDMLVHKLSLTYSTIFALYEANGSA